MTREEFEKQDWYMIQYKNPNTNRWKYYAGLLNRDAALKMLFDIRQNTLLKWRIKKHKIVRKY